MSIIELLVFNLNDFRHSNAPALDRRS